MFILPTLQVDGYKTSHEKMYPQGTTLVYSNFTPRKSRIAGIDGMVFFGLQYFIKEYLQNQWNDNFFKRPRKIVQDHKDYLEAYLGTFQDVSHIEALHDLGYLPIEIRAVDEGTFVPLGCPCLTIHNTHPDFFWLTNYLETCISDIIWKPCTSATTARQFRKVFDSYAKETSDNQAFVYWQGHDFSYRGMSALEDACLSGSAHLLYFRGTDTVPSLQFLHQYYDAPINSTVGNSIPASEHSVACAGGEANEMETMRRIICDVYPTGPVSLVCDSWDFWRVITEYLPKLREKIVRRWEVQPNSKLVIRPDSGIPHKIINGDPDSNVNCEKIGLAKCLEEIFGAKVNSKGYKDIHPSIGMIYGDGINLEEQIRMLEGLKQNGFASTNIVLGLGSYTYQCVTRDTFGTVCKATYCEINGTPHNIFKSPKTGAWKKSHKGLLRVNEDLTYKEECTWEEAQGGLLKKRFRDGTMYNTHTLEGIREKVKNQ